MQVHVEVAVNPIGMGTAPLSRPTVKILQCADGVGEHHARTTAIRAI